MADHHSDSDSNNDTSSEEVRTVTQWQVAIIDDTRRPYQAKNYNLKMPSSTCFRDIRNYLVKQRMVSYATFTFVSATSGETYLKTVGDETMEIGEVFEEDDNIILKLVMNTRMNFGDDDSDETPQRSSAYQRASYQRAKGYVGLSNQGATCYLNSLLQTLYMTPEFRKSLYDWDFEETCRRDFYNLIRAKRKQNQEKGDNEQSSDDAESRDDDDFSDIQNIEEKYEKFKAQYEDKSITRQLQKLFLQLQLSEDSSAETTNLTSSFGWSDDEAFTQHDVQELLRVLFDALEKTWKGTDKENFINQMYQGEMKDYVKCLNCGHESSRRDTYLDIPLVIKGFGETKAVSSVDEAIRKFTEKENLTDDNQYFCEKCNSKQDAEKGLTYLSFPYLLALQLKRFDFDYMTMRRVKLNDRVTFPEILDMNQYLHEQDHLQEELESDDLDADESDDKEDDLDKRKAKRLEALNKALSNGEYVYELYSILIHRGSAMGGHYFAYIKSFEKNEWMCFNDSSVTVLHPSQIEETYGEAPKKRQVYTNRYGRTVVTGGQQGFGSNAYMLMYRKYNPDINITEPKKEDISPALKQVFEAEQEKLQQQYSEKQSKRNRVLLKVYREDGEEQVEIKVGREVSLAEATKLALQEFKIELAEGERARLREYQSYYKTAGVTYDDDTQTLEKLKFYGAKTLVLEIVKAGQEFEVYDPNQMTLKVILYNAETDDWSEPTNLGVSKNATVANLKEAIEAKFGMPASQQLICKSDYNSFNARVLNRDNKDLRFNFRIQQGHTLWVEPIHPEADDMTYEYTYTSRMRPDLNDGTIYPRAFERITKEKNQLKIRFTDLDGKDPKHTVSCEKTDTLGELIEKIAQKLQISPDSFKLMKQSLRTELKNVNYTLSQYNISNSIPLLVISGQPLKPGEVLVQFELLVPTKLSCDTKFLFKIPVPESMLIEDVKTLVVTEYEKAKQKAIEESQKEPEPKEEEPKKERDSDEPSSVEEEVEEFPILEFPPASQLRLRELFSRFPSNVLRDDEKLKTVVRSVYSTPKIAVQFLQEGETETKKSMLDIVVFLQEFKRSEFDLGDKFEIITNNNESLDELRARITQMTGVENLGLISQDRWDTTKILSLARTKWYKPKGLEVAGEENQANADSDNDSDDDYLKQADKVRVLKLRDGDLIIFTDLKQDLKELTNEERAKLQAEEKSKYASKRRHGEEGVQIAEQSVDIDFFNNE